MYDPDDTIDLTSRPPETDPTATTLITHGDSLPELRLPTWPTDQSHQRRGMWSRFLNALLRAFAPWPV